MSRTIRRRSRYQHGRNRPGHVSRFDDDESFDSADEGGRRDGTRPWRARRRE